MFFYNTVTTMMSGVVKILFRVEVIGKENIPKEGACILACNHKSNWDPIMIAGLIKGRKINGVAKKELFKNPILRFILNKLFVISVDRDNPDISTVKKIIKVLKNNEVLGIFPEGTRHKDLDSFSDAKAGLGMFAVKGKARVVPVSIVTNYKIFGKLVIYIDNPIELDEFYGKKLTSEDYESISGSIMDIIKKNYFNIRLNEKNK